MCPESGEEIWKEDPSTPIPPRFPGGKGLRHETSEAKAGEERHSPQGRWGMTFPAPGRWDQRSRAAPSFKPGSERAGPWLAMKARGQGSRGWDHDGEHGRKQRRVPTRLWPAPGQSPRKASQSCLTLTASPFSTAHWPPLQASQAAMDISGTQYSSGGVSTEMGTWAPPCPPSPPSINFTQEAPTASPPEPPPSWAQGSRSARPTPGNRNWDQEK